MKHSLYNSIATILNTILSRTLKNKIKFIKWNAKKRIIHQNRKISQLKDSTDPIRILFIASNISMWRGQQVYELLANNPRFNTQIIISPFKRHKTDEAKRMMTELQDFFQRKNIPIKNTLDDDCDLKEYMDNFDPHIIFPCQPYNQLHGNILDFEHNKHRIYCYIPYGISIIKDDLTYNLEFHNLCWRFYLANNLHYQTALELMANKAINVKIVGEPDYDKFISESIDPWKKITDGKKRKRVIWSPHFSIQPNEYLHHSSFLWLFDEMIKIAKEYQDKIQIAFKPHPHLYSVLCSLDNWGENKAKEYYRIWAEMKNTQLEEGDYIGLFKFSDAMIHDCSSFTGEYLFVNKPVLFTSKNIKSIRDESNDFALKCLDLHYIGQSIEDIHFFIDNIVLHNHDTLKSDREIFYNDYLIPPGNKKVAENIFNDLYESFELVNH